jgi:hypothetical protein
MSLQLRNLSVGAYTQGTTAWFYVTPDSRRDLEGTTYWWDAGSTVHAGDWLFVTHTANAGNSIYAFYTEADPQHGPYLRVRRLVSSFGEAGNGG